MRGFLAFEIPFLILLINSGGNLPWVEARKPPVGWSRSDLNISTGLGMWYRGAHTSGHPWRDAHEIACKQDQIHPSSLQKFSQKFSEKMPSFPWVIRLSGYVQGSEWLMSARCTACREMKIYGVWWHPLNLRIPESRFAFGHPSFTAMNFIIWAGFLLLETERFLKWYDKVMVIKILWFGYRYET